MRADHNGVELTQPELNAAIMAAKDGTKVSAIAFEAAITTIRMYATDGALAIQATGDNEGLLEGRWRVCLPFLELVKKSMTAKDLCRLCFNGASLSEAILLRVATGPDGDPELEESGTITWHTDAVDHQQKFPFDTLEQRFRENRNDSGVPAPISPHYYEILAQVGKCGVREFERCPGEYRLLSPVFDVAKAENGTEWTCLALPRKSDEDGDRRKSRTHEVTRQGGLWDQEQTAQKAARDFAETVADMGGGTIEADGTTVTIKPSEKAKSRKPRTRKGVRSPEEVEAEATQ